MMANAKPVHHQETSNVGWLSWADSAAGALEYSLGASAITRANAHQPPKRGERIPNSFPVPSLRYDGASVRMYKLLAWNWYCTRHA